MLLKRLVKKKPKKIWEVLDKLHRIKEKISVELNDILIDYGPIDLNNIIEWWKKKATNRYNNLKLDNRMRKELEIWSPNAQIQIIR